MSHCALHFLASSLVLEAKHFLLSLGRVLVSRLVLFYDSSGTTIVKVTE